MPSSLKLLLSIGSLVFIIWIQYLVITGAYDAGYTAYKAEYQNKLLEQQLQIKSKERAFNEKVEALSVELAELRLNHENTINKLKSDYDNELLKSEQRAKLYYNYSQSSETKQRNLAVYTAKLDRSLTEGRELVRQLTETIRARDAQLKALGIYIKENTNLYE